jgi:ribosomal protein L11 methyltransferase
MPWWQFSVTCHASELEQIENLLLDLGAVSISLSDARDEPIYEPLPGDTPVWQFSIVSGMFDPGIAHEDLYQQFVSAVPEHLLSGIRQHALQDQDWEQVYKQHFKPICCTPGLWIVPGWCDAPEPDAINIKLDPGVAFGTGSHPTTALCLAWLGEHNIRDYHVIDYGCGSGILAIAACKLGASQALAVDIDPQALYATDLNTQANNISARKIQTSTPAAMEPGKFDLLMANILSRPLVDLAPHFADLVKPGGEILLSGILKTQLEDIQLAYKPFFELDQACFMEDWLRVSGIRNHV